MVLVCCFTYVLTGARPLCGIGTSDIWVARNARLEPEVQKVCSYSDVSFAN